jgi:RNA polymerase sigma-70 factor (ECF subfamily)
VADLLEIEVLIGRIGLNDRAAFSRLYDLTSAKLFGIAVRVLGNQAEAEDVLQDSYIKIWQGASRYAVNGLSPMTWLVTIVRNTAIDKLRARRLTVDIADQPDLADKRPNPEAEALASDERRRIDGCLARLEADRAAAVRGAYLDGWSYEDLARRFNVPLNTMRTWLRRSLMSLRECLMS